MKAILVVLFFGLFFLATSCERSGDREEQPAATAESSDQTETQTSAAKDPNYVEVPDNLKIVRLSMITDTN